MIKNVNIKDLNDYRYDILIDMRSVNKYDNGHIDGAINIPKEILVRDYNKILDKNKVYSIYCQAGINSTRVSNFLSNNGYNVINLIGGYDKWKIK